MPFAEPDKGERLAADLERLGIVKPDVRRNAIDGRRRVCVRDYSFRAQHRAAGCMVAVAVAVDQVGDRLVGDLLQVRF